jgi:hypothetical protein
LINLSSFKRKKMGNGGDVGPVKIGPNEIDHANMTDKIGPYETGPLKKKKQARFRHPLYTLP